MQGRGWHRKHVIQDYVAPILLPALLDTGYLTTLKLRRLSNLTPPIRSGHCQHLECHRASGHELQLLGYIRVLIKVGEFSCRFDVLEVLGYIRVLIKVGGFSWRFDVLQWLGYIRVFIKVGGFSWRFDVLQLLGYIRVLIKLEDFLVGSMS